MLHGYWKVNVSWRLCDMYRKDDIWLLIFLSLVIIKRYSLSLWIVYFISLLLWRCVAILYFLSFSFFFYFLQLLTVCVGDTVPLAAVCKILNLWYDKDGMILINCVNVCLLNLHLNVYFMVYMICFVVGEVLLLIGQTRDVVHRSSRGCML